MSFAVGSLVRVRGREWVVLPESEEDLLVVRPLGGTDEEVTGIHTALETIEPATFLPPDPRQLGDHRSCQLLRDAVRLGFRASAGPFRSFGQIAVEPRPYQLVPLLVALKLDPVRLLIADDVGIGKTIEACLVVRELMDRGEATRLAVLCPPQLAEQWQRELNDKFHIDTALVLPSTATRLERSCGVGQSLFDVHPRVVVSTEYIKSDRRRDDFLRACPKLVIVDEAHTCAYDSTGGRGRHLRHELVKGLAADKHRHLILVTATPHSGKEETFRSLLTFLDDDFVNLPQELSGEHNKQQRRRLAQQLVQRRRGDIEHYLQADTPFPKREEREESYKLSPEYKDFFDKILVYAWETVYDPEGQRHRQRVRWWSALALLRSIGSSPAAAAVTLRNRANVADTENADEADELGRRAVFDLEDNDISERGDVTPGGDAGEFMKQEAATRRQLLGMARAADSLRGEKDEKLQKAIKLIRGLVDDGYHPIIFCRFIPTAEYLGKQLREHLPSNIEIKWITGEIPPAEREDRVAELGKVKKRILVCTDCLSEGINLQDHFDAVVHYDLSWNPTRHEQREGRVDRFGQPRKTIRVLTYFGIDNQIDGIVLDVLIRKHKTIRSSTGISVPVPVDTNQVVEAIFEGLLLRERAGSVDDQIQLFEDFFKPQKEELHNQWEESSEREKRSRTMFAQETIKVDEVARELQEVQAAIGSHADVERFTRQALTAHQAVIEGDGIIKVNVGEVPQALRDIMGSPDIFEAKFGMPVSGKQVYLSRTHPWVSGLAAYVLDNALDPELEGIAKRSGVVRTNKVDRRTTLLLLRMRFHIHQETGDEVRTLLAEDCGLLAFEGSPLNAEWLDLDVAGELLELTPDANINPDQARDFLRQVVEGYQHLTGRLETESQNKAEELLDAHKRVRKSAQLRGVRYRVEPILPPDILGIYVYLPAGATGEL